MYSDAKIQIKMCFLCWQNQNQGQMVGVEYTPNINNPTSDTSLNLSQITEIKFKQFNSINWKNDVKFRLWTFSLKRKNASTGLAFVATEDSSRKGDHGVCRPVFCVRAVVHTTAEESRLASTSFGGAGATGKRPVNGLMMPVETTIWPLVNEQWVELRQSGIWIFVVGAELAVSHNGTTRW